MAQSEKLNLLPREKLIQLHYFALENQSYKEKSCIVSEDNDLWLNYDKLACNHICNKDLNELKEVNITDLQIGMNYGVKLIAKTIVKPRGFMNITTILQDNDKNTINCAIYNYVQILQHSVDELDSVLPIDTTLIIKEPYIKIFQNHNPAIRIDNCHLSIHIHIDNCHSNVISLDDALKTNSNINDKSMDMKELKENGNKYYKMKQYDVAIKYYSIALKKHNQDEKYQDLIPKLLNNRALCFIKLKEFQKAGQDATKALSTNNMWLKARYTLCSALLGSKRYKQALDVLNEIDTKNKACKQLEKTIKTKILETSKEFPYTRLWKHETDFVSDSIKVAWINDKKGLGFVATKDIKAGQLLVREKCFAVGYPVKYWRDYSHSDMYVTTDFPDCDNCNERSIGQYNLLSDVMKKYVNGADIVKYKLSLLYDGSNRKRIVPSMDTLKYDELPEDVKRKDIPILSVRRLMQIIEKNCFSVPVIMESIDEPAGCGLFIVSSFFNHYSKSNNCDNLAYPRKQIIFALKDVKKGEELTITYYDEFKNNFPFNYDDP